MRWQIPTRDSEIIRLNKGLTLYLPIYVFLQRIEAQLRFLAETTRHIPWGPSTAREIVEITTRVSPPVHRGQDAWCRLSTLLSLTHGLARGFVSSARLVLLWNEPTACIGPTIILGRCPSLPAHESESMLRTYLVCREKQERERQRDKQTARGRSTRCTNSDPITSTSELLQRQNSVTAHAHQS
jgi:hypothetical protein